MRLKEDKSNWAASNIIRKITPIPEEPVFKKKKPTRKWCKGVVGRKHDYVLTKKPLFGTAFMEIDKCTKCGKENYKSIRWR